MWTDVEGRLPNPQDMTSLRIDEPILMKTRREMYDIDITRPFAKPMPTGDVDEQSLSPVDDMNILQVSDISAKHGAGKYSSENSYETKMTSDSEGENVESDE